MELVIDDGKTVICPECHAHNKFDEPVKEGQIVLCHACRLRLRMETVEEKLVPVILADEKGKEDRTW